MNIHGGRAYTTEWLTGLLDGLDAQVSQCLNDIEAMAAWQGAAVHGIITQHVVNVLGQNKFLYHVSAGKMKDKKTKCTLFFVQEGQDAYIVAVGKHVSAASYDLLWKRESIVLPSTIVL